MSTSVDGNAPRTGQQQEMTAALNEELIEFGLQLDGLEDEVDAIAAKPRNSITAQEVARLGELKMRIEAIRGVVGIKSIGMDYQIEDRRGDMDEALDSGARISGDESALKELKTLPPVKRRLDGLVATCDAMTAKISELQAELGLDTKNSGKPEAAANKAEEPKKQQEPVKPVEAAPVINDPVAATATATPVASGVVTPVVTNVTNDAAPAAKPVTKALGNIKLGAWPKTRLGSALAGSAATLAVVYGGGYALSAASITAGTGVGLVSAFLGSAAMPVVGAVAIGAGVGFLAYKTNPLKRLWSLVKRATGAIWNSVTNKKATTPIIA